MGFLIIKAKLLAGISTVCSCWKPILKNNSNYEYIVYEKNESLNLEEGYGIQLSVNSISILNKLGFDKFKIKEPGRILCLYLALWRFIT